MRRSRYIRYPIVSTRSAHASDIRPRIKWTRERLVRAKDLLKIDGAISISEQIQALSKDLGVPLLW